MGRPRKKGLGEAAQPYVPLDDGLRSRFAAVIDQFESKRAAARAAGRSEDQIAKYEKGVSEPGFVAAARLARAAKVSLDWLFTGEGSMDEARALASPDELRRDGFVLIPRYAVEAAAGAGAVVDQEQIADFLAFKADWIRGLGRNPATLLVIQAMGDSMETTIAHGDVLLVDRTETRIRDNAIYVLVFGDALVVKRLERRRDGSVIIKSDNPRYAEEVVPKEEVDSLRVIGDVFWTGGRV